MNRIPELDGIRGLAIAMVIAWHYFPNAMQVAAFRLTWSGVDLFFVLSGFLIGGILLDSRDSPDYFRRFYTRRFFRIVPIYAAMLLLSYPLMGRLGIYQVGPRWAYPLFLQNFWMATTRNLGIWAVTWSLAVEEQFYLTLPAIVRYVRGSLPWLIAGGIIAAPILRVALFRFAPHLVYGPNVLMPCRADALLLGVVVSLYMRNQHAVNWLRQHQNYLWGSTAILLAGAGAIALHAQWIYGIEMASFGFTWLALVYTALLLLALTQPQSWLGAVLRFAPLRRLGTIAYGVYLLHQLLLITLRISLHSWPYPAVAIAAICATLLIAGLSWRYFEKPLIDYAHQ